MTITMKDVGEAAVQVAHNEWADIVRDPEDEDRIVHYHNVTGANWPVADGYQDSEDFWCGIFAAYCHSMVGDFLSNKQSLDIRLMRELATYLFPSTTRLYGNWKESWEDYDVPRPEEIEPENVRPGDIISVRAGRTDRPFGDHICLARDSYRDTYSEIPTFEGNAVGELGDGSRGEGVIRSEISEENIGFIYRLKKEHYTGAFVPEVSE